jgi:hypothetical protein
MLKKMKRRLANARFVRNAVDHPVDLALFRKRPSPKFAVGLGLFALSFLLGWPLIGVLGAIALRLQRPSLFAIGSPVAYAVSTVVFFLGIGVAGKDGLNYARTVFRWAINRFYAKYLSTTVDPSPPKEERENAVRGPNQLP